MTTDTVGLRTDNPYVGPRSFRRGDPLYGRTAECNDLRDLVVSERIVLVYSPSGAGKSSLLERCALHRAGGGAASRCCPWSRSATCPRWDLGGVPVRNRYVLSALLSLEEGVPPDHQLPAELLATMTLDEYLRARPDMDGVPGNEVLVFDQFEDILTADPTDEAGRRGVLRRARSGTAGPDAMGSVRDARGLPRRARPLRAAHPDAPGPRGTGWTC